MQVSPGTHCSTAPNGSFVIGFHYHVAQSDTPRLRICRGDRLCHVFSDLDDIDDAARELRAWANARGLIDVRIQERGNVRQHLDLWGPWLWLCGSAADRETLRRWLRRQIGVTLASRSCPDR